VNLTDGVFQILSFNVSGWRAGHWREAAMRKRLDDVQFLHNPTIADLDGDGRMEVIASSLGYLVRAWNTDGDTPAGWPKYTQNGLLASPVVGDVDGDGKFELVTHTNEGRIFAWETTGPACRTSGINAEWWSFHHDEWNTGVYGTDTLPPAVPGDLRVYFTDDPDVFEIVVTAPGDDGRCGYAAAYDLRYWTDATRTSPAAFVTGTALAAPTPVLGGMELRFTVTAPDATGFALRAEDENGLLGWPSPVVAPEDAPADDDTDDDTDDDADDDVDDDGDDDVDDDVADDDADDDVSPGDDDDDDDDSGCCGC
jgi:hypothetical protein